jgi:hypothetical protein
VQGEVDIRDVLAGTSDEGRASSGVGLEELSTEEGKEGNVSIVVGRAFEGGSERTWVISQTS